MQFKFNLRDEVKDTITGMKGVIIARTEWTNGCIRYAVQPKELKDGRPVDSVSFDEQDLELVTATTAPVAAPAGGLRPSPTRTGH